MHEVELAGGERFDQRRPAADERRTLGVEALLLEEAHVVRDQQRGRVGDRQIADAHDVIVGGAGGRAEAAHHGAQRCQTAGRQHVERLPPIGPKPEAAIRSMHDIGSTKFTHLRPLYVASAVTGSDDFECVLAGTRR